MNRDFAPGPELDQRNVIIINLFLSTPPSSHSDMGIRSEDSEGEIHSPKKDRKKSSSSRVGKKERRDKEKDSKYYSDLSDSEFSGQLH